MRSTTRQRLHWVVMFLITEGVLACNEDPCPGEGSCGKGGATGGANAGGGGNAGVGGNAGDGADSGIFAPARPGCDGMRLGPCTAVSDIVPPGPSPPGRALYVHMLDSTTVRGMLDERPVPYTVTRYYEGLRLVKEEGVDRTGILDVVRTFEYDDQGRIYLEFRDANVDGEIEEGSRYTYDDRGRLLLRFCYMITEDVFCSVLDGGMYVAWDDAGNPTEQIDDDSGDIYTYEYDSSCNLLHERQWIEPEAGQRVQVAVTDFDYSCW